MLAHNVYFTLEDNSAEKIDHLLAECKKYLARHPGIVFFGAGTLEPELERPVNDRDFDVALHVVFKDRASHDSYQVAQEHKDFIEANNANWKRVRVFDSVAEGVEG
jgi:hypothetical protein